jgi:hypothetical protein
MARGGNLDAADALSTAKMRARLQNHVVDLAVSAPFLVT